MTDPKIKLRLCLMSKSSVAMVFLIVMAVMGSWTSLHAQTTAAQKKSAWQRICVKAKNNTQRCHIVYIVRTGKKKAELMRVVISRPASTRMSVARSAKKSLLRFGLPQGFYLPAGLTFQVDNTAPIKVQILTCTKGRCMAQHVLDDKLLDTLRRGQTLKLSLRTLNMKVLSVSVKLAGFVEAFESIP